MFLNLCTFIYPFVNNIIIHFYDWTYGYYFKQFNHLLIEYNHYKHSQ